MSSKIWLFESRRGSLRGAGEFFGAVSVLRVFRLGH